MRFVFPFVAAGHTSISISRESIYNNFKFSPIFIPFSHASRLSPTGGLPASPPDGVPSGGLPELPSPDCAAAGAPLDGAIDGVPDKAGVDVDIARPSRTAVSRALDGGAPRGGLLRRALASAARAFSRDEGARDEGLRDEGECDEAAALTGPGVSKLLKGMEA